MLVYRFNRAFFVLVSVCMPLVSVDAIAEDVNWRCQTDYIDGSPQLSVLDRFAENVRKWTKEELTLEFYAADVILSDVKISSSLQSGIVDCVIGRIDRLDPDDPAIAALGALSSTPYTHEQTNEWFYNHGGNELARDVFADKGAYFLGPLVDSPWSISVDRPLNNLEDLKGLKLRVPNEHMNMFAVALGAEPVLIPAGEIFSPSVLDNGEISPTQSGSDLVVGAFDIASYGVNLGSGRFGQAGMAVGLDSWDRISENSRIALSEGMRLLSDDLAVVVEMQQAEVAGTFPKIEMSDWLDEDTNKFFEIYNTSWIDYAGQSTEAKGILDSQREYAETSIHRSSVEAAPLSRRSISLVRPMIWNSWITEKDDIVSLNDLKEYRPYSLNLDISPYNYGQWRKSVAATPVATELQQALVDLEKRQQPAELVFRVVGLGVEVSDRDQRELSVVVEGFTREASAEEDRYFDEFKSGQLELMDFSNKVMAGELSVAFSTKEVGCAAIAISIWDGSGRIPLDHVVVQFPVGANAECKTEPQSSQFAATSGLANFLTSAELPEPADAALHIFEVGDLGGVRDTIAVFVEGESGDQSSSSLTDRVKAYSWVMATPLSVFMQKHLHRYLDDARIKTRTLEPSPYSNVASKLHEQIFSSKYGDSDQERANDAFSALQEIVASKSPEQTTVFQRITSTKGFQQYLPLGLLSASGAELLERPINVVQPLLRENYNSRESCIEPWTLVVPTALDKQHDSQLSDMPDISQGSIHQRITTISGVEMFLDGEDDGLNDTNISRGQGLIVLSHHSDGRIWFTDGADDVGLTGIKRRFPPGSTAILAACQTLDALDESNSRSIEGLNISKMDQIIGSPFDISIAYGTRLAVELSKVVVNHIGDQEERRLVSDVFAEAANETSKHLGGKWKETELEFMILGDHTLELCSANE